MCMGIITIHAVVIKLLNFELAFKLQTWSIRGRSLFGRHELFEKMRYLDYMLY